MIWAYDVNLSLDRMFKHKCGYGYGHLAGLMDKPFYVEQTRWDKWRRAFDEVMVEELTA